MQSKGAHNGWLNDSGGFFLMKYSHLAWQEVFGAFYNFDGLVESSS